MAKIMIETFKDNLAYPMRDTDGKPMPSPNELKHKILIKGKRLSPTQQQELQEDEEDEDEEDDEEGESTAVRGIEKQSSKKITKSAKKKGPKVHPDLSAITFLGTGKVKQFTPAVSNGIPCDMMASYGETKVLKNMKSTEIVNGWIYHNLNHLRLVLHSDSSFSLI